jgi:DNA replication and repair protein RecF
VTDAARSLQLTQLTLLDVRTFAQLDTQLQGGITVLVGPNGVGKTNLLEAAATVLAGASPRTSNELRLIRDGASACRIHAVVRTADAVHEREVRLVQGRGKQLRLDAAPTQGVAEFARRSPSQVFLPERLLVIRGAPARRRALVDALMTQLDAASSTVLSAYQRALQQRNALLRQARAGRDVSRQLQPWTEQVVVHAAQLRAARRELLAQLAAPFADELHALTGLERGSFELEARGPDALADALAEQLPIDVRRGSTTLGPHLDDLLPRQAGRDLRAFGSTGEQRASLLAFTLAAATLVARQCGIEPVLLLDEPWSELDSDRRRRLSERLTGAAQVIATTTEVPSHLSRLDAAVHVGAVGSGTLSW